MQRVENKWSGKVFWKIGDYNRCKSNENCREIEREYKTSMVAHVALEPMAALANFVDGNLHIYAGHQVGTLLPTFMANYTGIKAENIIYHPHLIGGSFGTKWLQLSTNLMTYHRPMTGHLMPRRKVKNCLASISRPCPSQKH